MKVSDQLLQNLADVGACVEHAKDIDAAKRSPKPFIIDAVVSRGELALLPHISLKEVFGFGRSKVKEAALAASGDAGQWRNLAEEIKNSLDRLD